MSEHPIEGLMKTAMSSIESLVDVNTIVGEPINAGSGIIIIPISQVCFGFAAGGSEFSGETMTGYKKQEREESIEYKLPFGGGSGGTVSIKPIAFVTISGDTVKINPIYHSSVLDKLIDYIPDFMQKLNIDPDKILEKYNLKCNNHNTFKKDFDYELNKKDNCTCMKNKLNKNKECNNKDKSVEDDESEGFVEEKSKVKSVTSIESDKGPIKKKKVKIEYEDEADDFGLEFNSDAEENNTDIEDD